MKTYFTKSILILSVCSMVYNANAQKVGDLQLNNKETDCNNKTIMVGEIIALGLPVLITHQMYNCGNCKAAAEEIEPFVEANVGKISFVMGMSG